MLPSEVPCSQSQPHGLPITTSPRASPAGCRDMPEDRGYPRAHGAPRQVSAAGPLEDGTEIGPLGFRSFPEIQDGTSCGLGAHCSSPLSGLFCAGCFLLWVQEMLFELSRRELVTKSHFLSAGAGGCCGKQSPSPPRTIVPGRVMPHQSVGLSTALGKSTPGSG